MSKKGNEEELIANAKEALGDDAEILAAGVFGCQDLMKASVGGGILGAFAGQDLGGAVGAGLGAALGGIAARKGVAESRGETLKLVVAVTPSQIHIMNWGDGSAEERHDIVFERSSVDIKIKKMGLSRIIELHDPETDAFFRLHGTTGLGSQAGPDKHVMEVLAA